ncbi:hypothetical protein [Mediterraneibacter faecis]|uniref:hypothetical protein n=1 Tax=Mediterraneibacter faecis TaxID=592978 RepID=UPI003F95F92D
MMGEKDKRRYAYGGFPPTGKLYIQQDSCLICDDMVEELATIPTSMLKQKMINIDNLLDASAVFYGTFGTFNVNTLPCYTIGSNNLRKLHSLPMRRRKWLRQ